MLIGAAVLLLSVLASRASSRLGVPVLVLFLGIGMLAGSDGPGGIAFDNAHFARDLGTLSLAFILFAGGLETDWRTIRPVLGPGLSLATFGVAICAGLVGLFAWGVLGLPPLVSLLLGAVVSSTDASAVFAVLKGRGIRLQRRLGPLLEMESGSNDPMAVFLTLALTDYLTGHGEKPWMLVPELLFEMAIGVLFGYGLGRLMVWTINHVRLDYEGLYPVFTSGSVLLVYGGAHALHGNGFLAVYVAGVVLGSLGFLRKETLKSFHDGLAWLVQVLMFVTLGLLVYPHRLLPVILPGLGLALFLVFIARPVAVCLSLLPFRKVTRNEKLFVSWVGLRGAVPIVLTTIPLTVGVPYAAELFNLVFFIVLTSVMLQGTTIGKIANWLQVIAAPAARKNRSAPANDIVVKLDSSSPVIGKSVVDLNIPVTALLLSITRGGRAFVPQGNTMLFTGDEVRIATRKHDVPELERLFTGRHSVEHQ